MTLTVRLEWLWKRVLKRNSAVNINEKEKFDIEKTDLSKHKLHYASHALW